MTCRPPVWVFFGRAAAALAAALCTLPASAIVWTVDDNGVADFSSIQSAINTASNGDEIVVRPGRYRETLNFLGKAITVRSETGPGATTIFLEQETRIVLLDGDATLRGFTITGGFARIGAGIRVTGGADAVIDRNVIVANTADRGGSGLALGGGIAVENLSRAVITRNVIEGNTANGDAQGLFAYGAAIDVGDDCTAVITDNVIVGNDASDSGGAISVGAAGTTSPVEIAHNTILGNAAGQPGQTSALGGGILVDRDAVAIVRNNLLASNTAVTSGGGVYFGSGTLAGITYQTNDFNANTPNDCAGASGNRCTSGQFFLAPLFLDAAVGNYRPRSDSPVLDLGSTGGSSITDFDGNPRSVDGDYSGSAAPDIGAHENRREVTRLRFDSKSDLAWDGSKNASAVFDVFRDGLSALGSAALGTCLEGSLSSPAKSDTLTPAIGDGFLYLVRARATATGSLGYGSNGSERQPGTTCP